jgi:predicted DCC family thiol-disulfide oxidoreductase YuxK
MAESQIWLVYDGDCPFCSAYVKFIRLRESVGEVNLIDARNHDPMVEEVLRQGFDLDDGMVLKFGDRYYHGDSCVQMLALLSGKSGYINRLNAIIFRSPLRARVLYPVLRAARNIVLGLLRRKPLNHGTVPSRH